MPRRTVPSFEDLYGRPSEIAASAPGRVNLIGEHTDYNGGYVLPLAIPQRTRVELARRTDRTVAAWSAEATPPHQEPESYVLGEEEHRGDWLDYLQGATKILGQEGCELGGCDLRITSEVPLGSGLSSSAALTVALLRALAQAFSLALDDVRLARLAQQVETDFVGAPVGVMDPMAASLADTAHALFLDTRSLAFERVPLPRGAGLVVVDSAIPHRHAAGAAGATGEYRARRQECAAAAQLLGVPQLRDLTAADLPRIAALPNPLDRRARHVVTEDERVLAAVAALRGGDLPALGKLLDASHASLRDDYAVSVPDVDRLVELARDEPAVYGARLTGGGFGGSIVALARAEAAREAGERIARQYRERTGREGRLLVPERLPL